MTEESLDIMYPKKVGQIKILAMIPFHHIFGFVAVFLWYTFYGKTLVFPSSQSTKDLLYAVKKGKVTHLYSVPLFWDSIAQTVTRTAAMLGPKKSDILEKMIAYNTHKISKDEAGKGASSVVRSIFQKKMLGKHIRFCISGGGYLSPKTASLINGLGYPLYNGYGMTEIGVTSVELSPVVEQRLKGSIGKPLHGVEYKIVPLDGKEGEALTGELLVRSKITHTREYLGGALRRCNYEDGFFHTEDIAEVDDLGNYYIKSRSKDTIILANGENVYPDEIEVYFKDVSHVNNCVVLGCKPKGEKEELIGKDPLSIQKLGVSLSFVPEDRLGMGLVGSMDITDNMMLRSYRRGNSMFLDQKNPHTLAENVVEELSVNTPNLETPVRRLSGGNVQKVLVGREISSAPTVLLTAYAVRGLDINSSYTIYDLINRQKKAGVAVVYVGEDLDVLVELADRILVLCDGQVSGIVEGRGVSKQKVGLMMTRVGGGESDD